MIYNFMIKATHPSSTNVDGINFFTSSKTALKGFGTGNAAHKHIFYSFQFDKLIQGLL